jgi:uncharacterized membrane protein
MATKHVYCSLHGFNPAALFSLPKPDGILSIIRCYITIIIKMDYAHLHLILNHFPIIGTIIGSALMAYALYAAEIKMQKSILFLWIVFAALTPLVMNTGESAEEVVEKIPGVSEVAMEEHEEAAEISLWMMVGLGLISIGALFTSGKPAGKNVALFAFFFSLIVFASMARTGYLGGQIRHTEFSANAPAGAGAEAGAEAGAGAAEQDDD